MSDGPSCRDCADNLGLCPHNGTMCDSREKPNFSHAWQAAANLERILTLDAGKTPQKDRVSYSIYQKRHMENLLQVIRQALARTQ